jgi:hypothetical protein
MAKFRDDTGATAYVFAVDKGKAKRFAKRKGLTNYIPASRIEDFPREQGLLVILVGNYHESPEYELLFAEGGLFYDFKAEIYYDFEVAAIN